MSVTVPFELSGISRLYSPLISVVVPVVVFSINIDAPGSDSPLVLVTFPFIGGNSILTITALFLIV